MKVTKKDYYSKKKIDCPCCGWQGHQKSNKRKWLNRRAERLSDQTRKGSDSLTSMVT